MDSTNKRAPGHGALGGLRVTDCDTHHATDRPQDKARDRTSALLTALRGEYPVLSGYRSLSLGIPAAVHTAAPGVTGRIVNCALATHCRCDNYLKALAAGRPRFGLDGAPSGEVSEEHRVAAVLVLERRKEKAVKPPQVTRLLRLAKPRRRA